MARPYYEQVDKENIIKLRELISTLPPFVSNFFRGIEPTTSSRTRIAYAYDLRVFFDFLANNSPYCTHKKIIEITLDDLDHIKVLDLEEYMEYLKYYSKGDASESGSLDRINKERGISRKISSLKAFYNYFYRKEMIQTNPAALVNLPKIHDKDIVRLDIDEVAILLDKAEQGEGLTKKQKTYHAKNRLRDMAILTLLLGTGIRVSECVGLNIDDVDFKNSGIRIHRKGGKEVAVYFGDEVETALQDYLEARRYIIPQIGHEEALFLSMQNKRLSVRSVENLVKKIYKTGNPLKEYYPS